MTDEQHISGAWREWLETQTPEQLRTSMDERMQQVANMHEGVDPMRETLLREIGMIDAEIRRREESQRLRDQFFPRISLRNIRDAKLLAQLLHAHAQEVLGMSQQVLQYKRLADSGFPIGVHFMDPMTGETSNDIDQVLSDLAERAIFTAELLGAVSEEMLRLKSDEGVELDEHENEIFDGIVRLVQEMKGDEK